MGNFHNIFEYPGFPGSTGTTQEFIHVTFFKSKEKYPFITIDMHANNLVLNCYAWRGSNDPNECTLQIVKTIPLKIIVDEE